MKPDKGNGVVILNKDGRKWMLYYPTRPNFNY